MQQFCTTTFLYETELAQGLGEGFWNFSAGFGPKTPAGELVLHLGVSLLLNRLNQWGREAVCPLVTYCLGNLYNCIPFKFHVNLERTEIFGFLVIYMCCKRKGR